MALHTLSLFAGYGGLDLGIHRAARGKAQTVCAVEIEAYAAANLSSPRVQRKLGRFPIWSDVATFDGTAWRGQVDVLAAGIPCQPWSVAGARKGSADKRWLWADTFRILQECGASMLILECTPNLRKGGLPIILDDLASIGWSAEWGTYTAQEAGAPHRRARFFLVAWDVSHTDRVSVWFKSERMQREGGSVREALGGDSKPGYVGEKLVPPCSSLVADANRRPDAISQRQQESRADAALNGEGLADTNSERLSQQRKAHNNDWGDAPRHELDRRDARVGNTDSSRPQVHTSQRSHTQQELSTAQRAGGGVVWPPRPDDEHGWREYIAAGGAQPGVLGGPHGPADRVDRVRLLGNGVVPQQAELAIIDLCSRIGGE